MPPLLFLTQRIPYPPIKGEKIRAWHVLEHLARTHDVHLGCLIDDAEDWQHVPFLDGVCASTHFARLDRRRAKLACLRGLLTGAPLSALYYWNRGLAAWVRRVLAEIRPEVIFVLSSNMAPYILDRRGAERVRVVDLVDVDSAKWRAYAETGGGPMRWIHAREASVMEALERRIGRECDWSTFVSREEAALFTRVAPDSTAKVRAISNGVDAAYFDPALPFDRPFESGGPVYVFTGAMDYPPNVDAVVWFADNVLPLLPGARFVVVGASPAAEVMALGARPGITVTGRVPDVRPYLHHADAAVAPMRIARGIQNKVLEAMAMSRPVVVTPDALEGIAAAPGQEVLVAEGAEAFAAACRRALGPDGPTLGVAARQRVLSDYVWAERLRGFDALLAPQSGESNGNMTDLIESYLDESLAALAAYRAEPATARTLRAIAGRITGAMRAGRKLLIAGNGGSAADAQHIACEVVGRLWFDRPALPAIALTVDSSVLTALGNDYGYEQVFARQVLGLGAAGDVFLGISTSGRTPNILRALEAARAQGMVTIGLTGSGGGAMAPLCDELLAAPSSKTSVIQQIHIVAVHIICGVIEQDMFPAART